MSPNETIEFTCPHCMTALKVPASLAGITGPCPSCQVSITAPHPTPLAAPPIATEPPQATHTQHQEKLDTDVSTPENSPPLEPTPPTSTYKKTSDTPKRPAAQSTRNHSASTPKRKFWPGVVFPLLFLLLAAAVVYLILDLMGVLNLEKETEAVQEKAPTPEFNPNDRDMSLLPSPPKETSLNGYLSLIHI